MKHPRFRQGSRRPVFTRRIRFEQLEARQVLSAPTLAAIADVELLSGSPLHIPLDAFDADGDVLSFTATSNNTNVTTYIPEGNRSMRISVNSANGSIEGDMVLELFEDRVPRVTNQIIELAENGFYDGIIFHRVINGFMIQTGDPTGTGSGNSELPDFDDQFHVDLQHNTTGVLSMAKSIDDSNNSQFFITETPQRHLDFNHSIFGQLIEGFDILDEVSEVYTGSDTKPDVDVFMESVEIFVDNENGVLMLKAPEEGYTGTAEITVTVNDGHGGQDQVTFQVNVVPDAINVGPVDVDPHNGNPFLKEIDAVRTLVDTTADSFQLEAVDVEEDYEGENVLVFLDQWELYYGLQTAFPDVFVSIPVVAHEDLAYQVDPYTGTTTVTPTNGLVGIHPITVGVADYTHATEEEYPYPASPPPVDYQVVPVYIVPSESPDAELSMTLVREPTSVDLFGEVDVVPDDQWIDEWDSFSIEIWATVTEEGQFGVHTVSTDLTFDNNLFKATDIEYGPGFREDLTGQIDNTNGVANLSGTTNVFSVTQPYNNYAWDPAYVNLYGDNRPVLVARVHFEPNTAGSGVANNAVDGYIAPQTELGFAFNNAQVLWSDQDATALTTHTLENAELWPVMYDLDDDGEVGLGDLSYFASAYNHLVGDAGVTFSWASDFNHNGEVGLGDLSYFASAYGRNANSPGRLNYFDDFPDAWRAESQGAALMGTVLNEGGDNDDASDNAIASEYELYDAAMASTFSSSRRGSTTDHTRIDAVDLVLQLYDPR